MKSKLWTLILHVLNIIFNVRCSSHWIVTENGRIQSMIDSPFHLRRPYDLLALLDQETRRNDINNIYQDLVLHKSIVDKKSSTLEGASDLEARIYSNDADCLKAGKSLSEIDLFTSIASNGSDRGDMKLEKFSTNNDNKNQESNISFKVPDCTKYYDLPFSIYAYEHLNAMKNRKNITITPEENLKYLMPMTSVKEFGHQVAMGLNKNNSSWLHYNLATLYWRIEGMGLKAVECARRALYFVPRKYKDIPLLNLAGILHQSKHSKEAAILLHAAIDHDPYQAVNYLALGNVYAVLANYNRSINCFDNFLKLQPGLEDAINAKHAILCHKKLENGLLQLHESLQDILSDLHHYHSKQQQWLRLRERLIWEQAPVDTQTTLENLFSNREQRCIHKTSDNSKSTIMCDFIDPVPTGGIQVDIISLLKNYESASKKINEHITQVKQSATKVFQPKKEAINNKIVFNNNEFKLRDHLPPDGELKYPTTMSWKNNLYFDETGWPSKDECVDWNLPLTEKEDLLLPVFMPPENKGYKVQQMLSEYINIPEGVEHELPWYPPICELSKDEESLFLDGSRELLNENLKSHPYLRKILLSYVNNGNAEEAEIGQRIITAMHKQAGPTWVLATLASLYWRVRENTNNILDCLDLPFGKVPRIHADVMFISIGSIFHQMGLVDYALQFATFAFKLNYIEPSTNFLLALIHYTQNNPIRAMYYMKNVLRVESDYYDGYAEKLLKIWACRIKMGNYDIIKNKKEKTEEMCPESDGHNEEGVICSTNGEICKTASIQCFRTDKLHNTVEELSTKVMSNNQCLKGKGISKGLLPAFLIAEGSVGIEPDQSHLGSFPDKPLKAFHMKITHDDTTTSANSLSDFYVSVSLTDNPKQEAVLHVYDKSGTYQLSNFPCGDVQNNDFIDFTTMWESVASRNVDISSLLKPLSKNGNKNMEPFCFKPYTKVPGFLGKALDALLNNELPKKTEKNLFEWLEYMSNDHQSSLEELGTKIKIALQENVTSWVLNTAASIYWRVVGNAKEAAICLQHAMVYAPHDMRDIPLTNLANLLLTYGFTWDSLAVAQAALGIYPEFAVTHYTMGNIFNTLGELEKAITYYRSSLAIDPKFEPSRNKLVAVLCTFLLDGNDIIRLNEN